MYVQSSLRSSDISNAARIQVLVSDYLFLVHYKRQFHSSTEPKPASTRTHSKGNLSLDPTATATHAQSSVPGALLVQIRLAHQIRNLPWPHLVHRLRTPLWLWTQPVSLHCCDSLHLVLFYIPFWVLPVDPLGICLEDCYLWPTPIWPMAACVSFPLRCFSFSKLATPLLQLACQPSTSSIQSRHQDSCAANNKLDYLRQRQEADHGNCPKVQYQLHNWNPEACHFLPMPTTRLAESLFHACDHLF
jgi:hypothetical protein